MNCTTASTILLTPSSQQSASAQILSNRPSLREFDYQSYIDELGNILIAHELWDDSLSKRLTNWGRITFVHASTPDFEFNQAVVEKASKRINKLLSKILVNPLDRAPLEYPVLERHWVWEKWMLEDYQPLSHRSPFDGEEMLSPKVHTFAHKILLWAKTLKLDLENAISDCTELTAVPDERPTNTVYLDRALMTQQGFDSRLAMLKLFNYMQFAQAAIEREKIRLQIRQEINNTRCQLIQVRRETQELIAYEAERAEQNAAAHEDHLNRRIVGIEENHQSHIEVLQSRIEEGMRQLHITREDLANTKAKCLEQERNIHQVRALCLQKAREVEALQGGRHHRCIIA